MQPYFQSIKQLPKVGPRPESELSKGANGVFGNRKGASFGFRFHELRHCAITSLAESGASDSTIMAIAGHVSRRMLERYSHVRMEAKRKAVESVSKGTGIGGYDTNHDTKTAAIASKPM
jgi:integrase